MKPASFAMLIGNAYAARCLVLGQVLLAATVFAQPRHHGSLSFSLSDRTSRLATQDSTGSYALPDSFLIPGSEQVFLDSLRLHAVTDYDLDYLSGTLKLSVLPRSGRTLDITYRVFPFGLRTDYFHRVPVLVAPAADSAVAGDGRGGRVVPVVRGQLFPASRLRKSGSIVRGVSVGSNQNLQVDSGLRLQISGKLTRDVEVVASLTDQNTPIQPEGNTQTLQEIDKVFVQVKSPKLLATLGDFTLNLAGGRFTSYERKLEGVMAQGNFDRAAFKVSAAVSRGQFQTNQFLGQEGNQGPYQLTGANGNINILVLAGTEKVWIDGERMTRGENHDYTIEYGNGQITFTRNRLITQDLRITVDFQYSDESFQRNYLAAQGETRLVNDKVTLRTTFIRESDDTSNPLSARLTGAALDALEAAGDSLALVRGDTLVAAGQGNYTKDSTGVFVFVGQGRGDYRVSFSFFGPGKGAYRNLGLGRFEFVGENQGDYRPFLLLPSAQKHDMFGVSMAVAPTSSLKISSELALSNFDRNLSSPRDDGDNSGAAYQLQMELKPEKLRIGKMALGQFDFSGRLRHKAATFRDIDRSTIAEFGRRWNLTQASSNTSEDILEMQANYLPAAGITFRGGIGRLQRSAAFRANRFDVTASVEKAGGLQLRHFLEFIDRRDRKLGETSQWLRQRGHAEVDWGLIKPLFDFEGEIRKDARSDTSRTGFRFESYTGGAAVQPWKSLSASARFNVRDDKNRSAGKFVPHSISRTQSYALGLKNWHTLSLDASYVHRQRNFTDPTFQDTRSDLADIGLGIRPPSGWLRGNINYQISNTQIARQEEVFVRVNEGEGNFKFNEALKEFEPDPFGDFVRRLFATNQFVPVVELRLRTDLRLRPAKLFTGRGKLRRTQPWLARLLRPVSTESFLRIDERSREKDVARIYLLQPSAFQQDSTTIFGRVEIRQDVYLWQNSRKLSFRYRYRNRMELNNQFVGGGQDRDVREQQLRGLYQFSPQVSTQFELTLSAQDRAFQSTLREDRKVRSRQALIDFVWRPRRAWEIASKSTFSFNKDVAQAPETRATLVSFAPRATYSFSQKGRLRAEIDWTHVSVAPKSRLIPFELTNGRRAGASFRWNLGFEYTVSQYIRTTVSYFGRSDPDRPTTQHVAKVEMRAFF